MCPEREKDFFLFFFSPPAKSATRWAPLEGSGSGTGLAVCLCHVRCVHSCTTGLLNQPALLNIAGLFTQERRCRRFPGRRRRSSSSVPPVGPVRLAVLPKRRRVQGARAQPPARRTRTQFELPAGRPVCLDAAERQVCHRCTNTHLSDG